MSRQQAVAAVEVERKRRWFVARLAEELYARMVATDGETYQAEGAADCARQALRFAEAFEQERSTYVETGEVAGAEP